MIDIFEINALRFSEKFRYPNKKIFGITISRGFIYGLFNFVQAFLLSFFKYPLSYNRSWYNNDKILIMYNGKNQLYALQPIYNNLKLLGYSPLMITTNKLPMWQAYIKSIPYIPKLIRIIVCECGERRKVITNEFCNFLLSFGIWKLEDYFINKYKFKVILLANDHMPLMRSMMMLCKKYNIVNLYVQHAAVTERFPKLIAKYAFLDGLNSLKKYKKNHDVDSQFVYLIGGSRFDNAYLRNDNESNSIGIALTKKDEQRCWEKLALDLLHSHPSIHIIMRPHPRMSLSVIEKFCRENGISYSDPSKEDSFTFINRLDLLIANETSIHLDAVLLHKHTILYTGLSGSGLRDHYNMVKDGLITYVDNFNQLNHYIDNPHKHIPLLNKIREYNASYMTSFEGNVSKEIAKIVDCIIKDKDYQNNDLYFDGQIVTIKYVD